MADIATLSSQGEFLILIRRLENVNNEFNLPGIRYYLSEDDFSQELFFIFRFYFGSSQSISIRNHGNRT